jgi:putative hydrolase of the HAD superfamily
MSGIRYSDIKTIFFDVGNTLLRPYPSFEAVCREVLERYGQTASDEQLRRGIRVADDYYEYRYWADDTFWSNERDASEMWGEMYALMLEEIGVDGDRHEIGRAIYDHFGHGSRWRTFPDVVPVFERLKDEGFRLGLISNWDSRLAKLCFDMGLDRYLDSVVSSASIGLIKPDPFIFEIALGRLRGQASSSLHVGDHYYADILGARSAGIAAVMIDRWGGGHPADVPVIEDLYGLLELIGLSA